MSQSTRKGGGPMNSAKSDLSPVNPGGWTMNRFGGWIGIAALMTAVGLVCPAFAAGTDTRLDQKLKDATAVYHELLATPDRGVPEALLKKCRCIAVIPHVLKGAFVYGARYGTGVMS